MVECKHVLVSGRVQGVAFRWNATERARRLGVNGWVRNLPDGRVEVWIEGEAVTLDRMLEWLARGPPGAAVTDLAVTVGRARMLDGFDVRA